MDVRFLNNISEAYIMDTGLNIEPDQIFNELYDIVKFLQVYDNMLYNELYESTKLQQQRILKNYLDISYESELLTEFVDPFSLSGGILVSIVGYLFGGAVIRSSMSTISALGSNFDRLGKWLSKHGKYSQLRYAIIQENTRECYAVCGIRKPSDLSPFAFFKIKEDLPGTKIIVSQGKCLRECYLMSLIDVIALHMENYFACLKKTGTFNAVQKTDSDDIMKMISNTNISSVCVGYYEAARDALENFYRTLELVYASPADADQRFNKINVLRSKIYEARQTVQKADQNEFKRYDQPQSQQPKNPNFKRS